MLVKAIPFNFSSLTIALKYVFNRPRSTENVRSDVADVTTGRVANNCKNFLA